MKPDLIAPCGMNCRLCRAYGRERNPCPGCRSDDYPEFKTAVICKIKNCKLIVSGQVQYCFECESYPCKVLDHLDKRYRTNYGMSMIDNLEIIRNAGVEKFIDQEKERWACPKCGEMICVHKEKCVICGHKWR
jgi:hypothetical protein